MRQTRKIRGDIFKLVRSFISNTSIQREFVNLTVSLTQADVLSNPTRKQFSNQTVIQGAQ